MKHNGIKPFIASDVFKSAKVSEIRLVVTYSIIKKPRKARLKEHHYFMSSETSENNSTGDPRLVKIETL